MIHQATQLIYDGIKEAFPSIIMDIAEVGEASIVDIGVTTKQGCRCTIRFISQDEDNDVAVRAFGIVRGTPEKRDALLRELNEINRENRYTKVFMDGDDDINISYDLPEKGCNPKETAVEMLVRTMRGIDNAYPRLMRILWG